MPYAAGRWLEVTDIGTRSIVGNMCHLVVKFGVIISRRIVLGGCNWPATLFERIWKLVTDGRCWHRGKRVSCVLASFLRYFVFSTYWGGIEPASIYPVVRCVGVKVDEGTAGEASLFMFASWLVLLCG